MEAMVLHARGEGVPCSSYSTCHVGHDQSRLMENLPNRLSHHRHLLLCCPSSLPFFHEFFSLSRLGVAPTNWSKARCTKTSFQQVFIYPKCIPIEGVMSLFPRYCNLPRADFSTCISDVWDIAPPVGLQLYRSWMRWTEDLMEILNIQLSCIVNLWTCAQNWWGLATSVLETWRCWWWCSKFWAQFPSSSFEFHVLHG